MSNNKYTIYNSSLRGGAADVAIQTGLLRYARNDNE